MSLTIAIDASRSTHKQSTGTEYWSRRLIDQIIRVNETRDEPHRLQLYFRQRPTPGLYQHSDYVEEHIIPFKRMWTHVRFAAALWSAQPDVTFVPAHTLPLAFPGKAVATVHDLGFEHFPQTHQAMQLQYLRWTTRHSARRAERIIVISQATADDLATLYQVPQEKIRVVYPGVDIPARETEADLHEKYGIPRNYFLFLGTLQPRKNIERMVGAYKRWQNLHPDKPVKLVLAGKPGWLHDPAWTDGIEGIIVTGYIDEADKGPIIRGAMGLLFPSLYEGFGFPVVEAMLCGIPVIASNTSSLPEIIEDAGILVDPLSEAQIASAMDLLIEHKLLHRKLSVKGRLQAMQFKWQRAAEQTLAVLEETAETAS